MLPIKIPDDFPHKIRKSALFTLILIKRGGDVFFENASPVQKDALVEQFDETGGDLLLMTWTGQYRSDVFLVTPADLERHYK
jgi:hypothetical protein